MLNLPCGLRDRAICRESQQQRHPQWTRQPLLLTSSSLGSRPAWLRWRQLQSCKLVKGWPRVVLAVSRQAWPQIYLPRKLLAACWA